jgi:sugar phosphate isomerase/epimerase
MTWTLSAFADEADGSIDGQVAAAKAAGLTHIDLRNLEGHNITQLPLDVARQCKAKLDDAGIAVLMYGSPIGKIDIADDFAIDVERLEHLAKLRDVFGSNLVRIFSYFNKQGAPAEQHRDEALSRLAQLAEQARALDMVLYHENESHIFGYTLDGNVVIRDEVRAQHRDHFKMIFDFDNYNAAKEDCWANWLELRDTTDAIHLKDSKWTDATTKLHVPVGTGDGKVNEILADAAERGWEGPLILEPHLSHSAAVLATGPSGVANQSLKDLTPQECFQLAAEAAIAIMHRLGKR